MGILRSWFRERLILAVRYAVREELNADYKRIRNNIDCASHNTCLHWDEIILDYVPRREILSRLDMKRFPGEPEMTEFESAFLCGVLNKFQPRKIVEVGIAAGATSAVIIECMVKQRLHFELHSIDYEERFYRDDRFQSGQLGIEADNLLMKEGNYQHHFHYGNIAASFDFGDDIDCLILDTIHLTPGEVFDFITLLPKLKEGCIVILHDTIFQHINNYKDKNRFATSLLISSVTGEKYINIDSQRGTVLPNIGAFVVGQTTRDSVSDVFLSLLINWNYTPKEEQIAEYRKKVCEYYDQTLVEIFDVAVNMNRNTLITRNKKFAIPYYDIPKYGLIILWGEELIISDLKKQLDIQKSLIVKIMGDIDSFLKGGEVFDLIIVAVDQENIARERIKKLLDAGVEKEKIYWRSYNQR